MLCSIRSSYSYYVASYSNTMHYVYILLSTFSPIFLKTEKLPSTLHINLSKHMHDTPASALCMYVATCLSQISASHIDIL